MPTQSFASISKLKPESWEQLRTCANPRAEGTLLLVSNSTHDRNRANTQITIDDRFDTICYFLCIF
jgi:hypothetical protein